MKTAGCTLHIRRDYNWKHSTNEIQLSLEGANEAKGNKLWIWTSLDRNDNCRWMLIDDRNSEQESSGACELCTFMCHWNGKRWADGRSYRDCWIALTAEDPERKASTVSVVALAFSSIIIYTNNFSLVHCKLSESRYVWPWLKIRLHLASPDHELAIENLIAAQFVFHTTSFSSNIELQLQQ